MRLGVTLGAVVGALAVSGSAAGEPTLEIRGAAARVTVIPEARRDIVLTVTHTDSRLPIWVRHMGDHVYLTGDVAHRVRGCQLPGGRRGVYVAGRGAVVYDQLPSITVRTPMGVRLIVGDGVFGEIGRGSSVDFTNLGCGDWTVADVPGRLKVDLAGAGGAHTGAAGSADLSVGGSGGIAAGVIHAGMVAVSSGSGNISAAAVSGPVDARVAGSGDIDLARGFVTTMTVSIAGSGAVRLKGVAQRLKVSIAGSGDVSVDKVTGSVSQQIFGPGAVRVGQRP